ncbi:uncharacterized protein LOC111025020 [Momordica charantia]|uniref:Uncharacterized protein LOC111025020 n=1 Tax=Momordica charantia TaxID=3673 RepID=A0A6J1DXJ5_MOMCH|nr:uncharacterized protein LOC111025020 [Momordica charantia]
MITRAKDEIFKPKVWVNYTVQDWTCTEPTRVKDALDTPQWKAAMEAEFMALMSNKMWHFVPSSLSLNVVGSKWIFQIKHNSVIQWYKARLVAKEFHQNLGIDFFETFSPVLEASTIRVVLTLVETNEWALRNLDFNNAFLNGRLDGDVYMQQPPEFEDPNYPQCLELGTIL